MYNNENFRQYLKQKNFTFLYMGRALFNFFDIYNLFILIFKYILFLLYFIYKTYYRFLGELTYSGLSAILKRLSRS